MRLSNVLLLICVGYVNAFVPYVSLLKKIHHTNNNVCSVRKIIHNSVSLLRASLHNKKTKWEPPQGYIPDSQKNQDKWIPSQGYIPYNEKIAEKIDNDIDELFNEDALFSDITRETLYINNKFDKLLDDINHMKNTVENIKKHNSIINIKSHYYNVD
mgnify:FL=1|jgi:hypothetical protein